MSLKDELRKKLAPDLFTQVTDALGDDFNYDVVPRSRLNKVIGQRDALKEQIEQGSKGAQTSAAGGDDDDDGFQMPTTEKPKAKGTQKQLTEEDINRRIEEATKAARNEVRIQFAGLEMLRDANAVDPELLFTLIDKSKLAMDDSGKLTGMEEQINALKTSKPNLFPAGDKGGRKGTPSGTGKEGGAEKFETVKSKEDFLKLSTADQIKFKEAHPDVFKSYLSQ